MADTTITPEVETETVETPDTTPEATEAEDTGRGSKDAVLADLARERAKRKEADQKLAAVEVKLSKLAEALGVEATETVDPDALAADLAAQKRENAVLRAGAALHLDTDALLDSRRFTTGLADIDPSEDDAVKAYLNEFVEANPQYAPAETRTYNPGDGAPQRVPANHPAANVTGTDRMAAALAYERQQQRKTR